MLCRTYNIESKKQLIFQFVWFLLRKLKLSQSLQSTWLVVNILALIVNLLSHQWTIKHFAYQFLVLFCRKHAIDFICHNDSGIEIVQLFLHLNLNKIQEIATMESVELLNFYELIFWFDIKNVFNGYGCIFYYHFCS